MMNCVDACDKNSRENGRIENEERSIAFGAFPSFFRSLDACFNYMLFGVPIDHPTEQGIENPEIERNNLIVAKCELLQLPSEKNDKVLRGINRSYTPILHCQQEETWDCGVTCMLMFMRYLGSLENNHNSSTEHSAADSCLSKSVTHLERLQKQWMLEKLQTESIWTIDLVMLLESIFNEAPPRLKFPKRCLQNRWNVKYLYCSNNLGVDETYKGLNYYKNAFGSDERRVKRLFKLAHRNKIPMMTVSRIDIEFVVDVISRENCIAIVLIDYSLFGRKYANEMMEGEIEVSSSDLSADFSGHYVILSGISRDENDIAKAKKFSFVKDSSYCMVIHNPGCADDCTFMGKEIFETSWRATGTDCDILFLAVNKVWNEFG